MIAEICVIFEYKTLSELPINKYELAALLEKELEKVEGVTVKEVKVTNAWNPIPSNVGSGPK